MIEQTAKNNLKYTNLEKSAGNPLSPLHFPQQIQTYPTSQVLFTSIKQILKGLPSRNDRKKENFLIFEFS